MVKKQVSLPLGRRAAVIALLALLAWPASLTAQTSPEPEREMLLNGLRILYWPQAGNPNVLLKLRIHSGAAFDLTDRGGMMALLGDALFPDPTTREYVTEELGGRLEVTTSHDAIDVSISGKASELERMVDLLRAAVLTTQLGVENVATLRTARIKLLTDKSATAADVADRAVAARLFGSFPYANSVGGTPATVAKIERGDLLLGRERFLYADNASLAVVGGVQKPRLMRALRQLLGPWSRADRTIPATFRQPSAPDARILALDFAGATNAEIRLAVRGLSRADNDALAADLLALIVRERWRAGLSDLSSTSVRHEAHMLPGMFMLAGTAPTGSTSKAVSVAQDVMRSLAQSGPSVAELEGARSLMLAEISKQMSQPESMAGAWLDVDTFKSSRPSTVQTLIRSLTAGDVQRVAARLFKDVPVATVVVGNYEQLKAALAGKIELRGEAPDVKITVPAVPPKKP